MAYIPQCLFLLHPRYYDHCKIKQRKPKTEYRVGIKSHNMKILLATFLFLIGLQYGTSQSEIYIGEKSFPSTSTWSFETNKHFPPDELLITVAKATDKKGYVMIEGTVPFNFSEIGGPLLLYLNNGKVLTLQPRILKDNVDEKAISIYTINETQIKSLCESNIVKVRYSIIEGATRSNYTAQNIGITTSELRPKKGFLGEDLGYENINTTTPYNTSDEISFLFGQEVG